MSYLNAAPYPKQVLNRSQNAFASFPHSLANSDVISGSCPCRVGKCNVLPLSSWTYHGFNFASNYFTFDNRSLRSWFSPWSLTFKSDRYLVMSTMKAKPHIHLSSLRTTTGFPFISIDCSQPCFHGSTIALHGGQPDHHTPIQDHSIAP